MLFSAVAMGERVDDTYTEVQCTFVAWYLAIIVLCWSEFRRWQENHETF
jgi:hypothetical protein